MQRITPTIMYKYLTCPQWVWLDVYGDPAERGEMSEVEHKLLEFAVANEERFIARFIKEAPVESIAYPNEDEAYSATLKAMERGAPYIYHAQLRDRQFVSVPTLLVKRDGTSKFGDWFYEPVDVKSSYDIKEEHKYALMIHALALETMQHHRPEKAGIITVEGEFVETRISDIEDKFFTIVEKLDAIFAGEKPETQITKACMNTPWAQTMLQEAQKADDIALIYKLDKRSVPALRGFGITTVEDARHIDVDALDGNIPHLKRNGLERVKMQAESLKIGAVFQRRRSKIPAAAFEIYFDIEGDPLYGGDYLFGFLVDRADGSQEYKRFLAESPEDEAALWRGFLDWIRDLPEDFVVFHYSAYETSRLSIFRRKYSGDMTAIDHNHLDRFIKHMFDLNDVVKEDFVFPLYFYGLKHICKFLGFSWDDEDADGVASIEWYEDWLQTHNRAVLEKLVQYNENDVRATKFLKDWIVNYQK